MNKISFTRSLLEFNRRVLYEGNVSLDHKYSFEDLKNKLFYNKIFLSNTNEMFEKYKMNDLFEDYKELVDQYTKNISAIEKLISELDNEISINHANSFEKRLCILKEAESIHYINFRDIIDASNRMENCVLNNTDRIYYLTISSRRNPSLILSYIDKNSLVYKNALSYNVDGCKIYLKTDEAILSYLNDTLNGYTIAISATSFSNDIKISKIEYNTDKRKSIACNTIERYLRILFPEAFIINNKFLYTDDIDQILDSNIVTTNIHTQEYNKIELSSIFSKDYLIEYPKDSFDTYLYLLDSASKNIYVRSIYITLYRIGNDPSIYYILKNAVKNNIEVFVNIELYASGEYITNSMWMKEMKKVGIHVSTYKAGELKVHSKLTLIKFDSGKSIAQIGTGNYHTKTTSQYTDLSLVTSDEDICSKVEKVFNILNGNIFNTEFDNMNFLVTRYNARRSLIRLIDIESNKWKDGYISFKCNALDDNEIIEHLNQAAHHGCKIDLIVRGVCTWIPDELGKNVTIKSIIWDKLEHSRVYCFGKFNPKIYIGSLDLVKHKLNKRIETLVRIKDPDIILRICEYLNKYITNTEDSWLLTDSGMYIKEK